MTENQRPQDGSEPLAAASQRSKSPDPVSSKGGPAKEDAAKEEVARQAPDSTGAAVPPPRVDLPGPESASGSYVPTAGAAVPPPPVDLPGPDATTAGLGGATSPPDATSGAAKPPSPLDSPQLVESTEPPTHIANDPLAGKEVADDPMGSDPRSRDRSNPR
ncbi:hypothetical protein [Arthrobacter sp. NPDC093139]|uniref:hypothetical protein n=1 Tax=Arthrobacter sp. NPDC093139 TaxID=3363945 RepID=UPI00380A6D43